MKKTHTTYVILFLLIALLMSCSPIMDLPDSEGNPAGINRDPNKFVQISPDWTFDQLNLVTPMDVFASKDGRLYIADSSENRIRVIRPSGEIESGIYDTLDDLSVQPTAVCLDARFNVYYVDEGNKIYAWPQFSASVGIEGIVSSRYYNNNGSPVSLSPLEGLSSGFPVIPYTEIVDTTQTAIIDSMLAPHVFYDPQSLNNREGVTDPITGQTLSGNPVYATINKSFIALAPATDNDLFIYVADAINDQILRIRLIPTIFVKLKNGQLVWHYEGVLDNFIATAGTGAGTVSKPVSMASDRGGNVYYTQTGDFFSVHKLSSSGYGSDFLVGVDDIMRLGEYGYAQDIAVASDGNIFVLDTLDHDVKMYSPSGEFLKPVVVREEWILISDSSFVGDSLVVQDTLVLQQYPDLLSQPLAITVYNDVLYTLDNGNRRILRFTKVDDVIIDDPDRED
ncbi:MAG: hypothetical protein KAT14_01515 [Candidatus Marinimicrobia bacterium]|nr:hypothetical protein [Candidatus Neomarinimicrobiota bacterium]